MGKHNKDEKPGVDWEAKKEEAGSKAKEPNDRPYRPDPRFLTPPDDDELRWG